MRGSGKGSFDQMDRQIILILRENARASNQEIAARVSLSPDEIEKRITRLISAGAGKMTMVMDPEAFGYQLAADIFLSLDKGREKEIIEELAAMPFITYLGHGQDPGEIAIEVRFKNSGDLYSFVKERLPSIPGVIIEEFTMLPRILKNIDQWIPPEEDFE